MTGPGGPSNGDPASRKGIDYTLTGMYTQQGKPDLLLDNEEQNQAVRVARVNISFTYPSKFFIISFNSWLVPSKLKETG